MADVEVYDAAYVEALEASVIVGGRVNTAGQLVLQRGNGEEFNAGQVVSSFNERFPIGFIYLSYVTANPADLLGGGVWTRMQDRMLIGAGSNARWDSIGETGGAETVQLSVAQMPSHDHNDRTGEDSPDHGHNGSTSGDGTHTHGYEKAAGVQAVNADGAGNAMDNAYNPTQTNPDGSHVHSVSVGGATARHTHDIVPNGGDQAHENMPPFEAVYIWRRTANLSEEGIMIGAETSGSFKNTDAFLRRMAGTTLPSGLEAFAQAGVDRLKAATPQDSGDTANGWYYEIDVKGAGNGGTTTIWWCNSHQVNGFNVAVGLQYGHGTGSGGYVQPNDFINPALKPIFDQLAEATWKEVTKA